MVRLDDMRVHIQYMQSVVILAQKLHSFFWGGTAQVEFGPIVIRHLYCAKDIVPENLKEGNMERQSLHSGLRESRCMPSSAMDHSACACQLCKCEYAAPPCPPCV